MHANYFLRKPVCSHFSFKSREKWLEWVRILTLPEWYLTNGWDLPWNDIIPIYTLEIYTPYSEIKKIEFYVRSLSFLKLLKRNSNVMMLRLHFDYHKVISYSWCSDKFKVSSSETLETSYQPSQRARQTTSFIHPN